MELASLNQVDPLELVGTLYDEYVELAHLGELAALQGVSPTREYSGAPSPLTLIISTH